MGEFGPFRPLRPYSEADRSSFFGRERELGELTEVLHQDRPSALLLGEPGVGKTSLVRAALIPACKTRGMSCTYVDAKQIDERLMPQSAPGGTLLVLDDLGASLDGGPRFEKLLALLQRVSSVRGLKILAVLDDQDLWRLDALERLVGKLGPEGARVRLERFEEARVADIIERSVLGGGAYFEAGLSQEMAVNLTHKGPASPAELQLVAGTAVALRLTNIRAYRGAGGADVVAWRFFERACALAGGHRANRVLAEVAGLNPREVAPLGELSRAAGTDEPVAERLCATLVREQLLERATVDGTEGYRLAHEWARPAARAFTGEARGRGVAARLLLRRKIESGGLLSVRALVEVRRFAGLLEPDEDRVMRRSVQVAVLAAVAILAMPIVALVLTYSSYGRTAYLEAQAGQGASVVARLGRRSGNLFSLPHSPAFGSVIGDSGFTRAALKGPLPEGAVARSGDEWLRRLRGALKPLPEAAVALILDGDVKPLEATYEDPALRPAVIAALGAAGSGAPSEVELIRRAQRDTAEAVRRNAVLAAAAVERRTPGAGIELLATAAKDPAPAVRTSALQEIVRLPDEQSAPMLVAVLTAGADPVTHKGALEALGACLTRTPKVAATLAKPFAGAARAEISPLFSHAFDLGGASADAIAEVITQIALDPKAPEDARIDALKMLRRRATAPPGVEAVTGSPKLLAAALPLALRAKPDDAAAKLAEAMHGATAMRAAAAAAIGILPKTPDTPKLLKVLEYDPASEVHAEAVRALPVLGRDALALLIKEARGAGPDIERAAVETLGAQAGKLGVFAAAQALEASVRGGRPSTRKAAIEALGHLGEQKPALAASALGRLLHDKVPDVRSDAANALGDVLARDGKEAIVALRSVAHNLDPGIRKRAAGALGRAHGALASVAAKALVSFVSDPEAQVRTEAAEALGGLGVAAREVAPLAALIGDRDPSVRQAGRKAAQQIGGSGAELDKLLLASWAGASAADKIELAATAGAVGASGTLRAALADADVMVRRTAAEHAGGLDPAHVSSLVAALGDPDMAVRVAAVRGLVGVKAAAALAQAARSTDRDVRSAALAALGEVGSANAKEIFEAALSDASERVRVAAVRGLTALGPPAAEAIERALRDPSRDVREAAVVGLGSAWSNLPIAELALPLRAETDADRRYAAALALAHKGDGPRGVDARKLLEEAGRDGAPATRLSARIARAFVGRPEELANFVRLLRDGN